jgi:carboxyl-terminal processing protease
MNSLKVAIVVCLVLASDCFKFSRNRDIRSASPKISHHISSDNLQKLFDIDRFLRERIGIDLSSIKLQNSNVLSITMGILLLGMPFQSLADDAWSDRNRLAAETWRTVDELFYDRNFNGQDWFKLRQSVVKKSYSNDDEVYSSLQSMLSKLGDKYTRYLTPAQYGSLMNAATGELTGVGVQLLENDKNQVFISNIEEDSPAASSDLRKGDVIINVDGTDTSSYSPEEVASIMRGKKDTKASFRVDRNGKLLDIVVVRQPFKLRGVVWSKQRIDNKNIGVVNIKSFSTTTKEDVIKAMESLHHEDLDAIILDLRNNGGGVLQAAVDTAAIFLPPGKIITFVVGKDGLPDALQTLPNAITSNDPSLPNLRTKLFMLVNSNTASAAEVITAGLKENDRATIVGEKTFGKGVIQNLQQLAQGGVAVTTARYETPLHHNINKIGIPTDISIECKDSDELAVCLAKFIK